MAKSKEVPAVKPNYRSSYIVNYFSCPQKYEQSLKHPLEQNDAMREGLLFEGYVFDKFKENNEADLIGRKKPATIDAIKSKAAFVKPLFLGGEPFKKLFLDTPEYTISGEMDYIGTVMYEGKPVRAIADLKFTGNIKIWDELLSENRKENFIQSILYPYLHFKTTGELLPFVYFVVENNYDNPLIKTIRIDCTEKDFEYIVDVINKIHNDDFFYANAGYGTCVNGKFGRCDFLEFCQAGRGFLADPIQIDFKHLN